MHKNRIILLVAVIQVLTLAACASNNPTPEPSGTPETRLPATTTPFPSPTPAVTETVVSGSISIWHSWDESDLPTLAKIIDDYHGLHPDVLFDVLYVPVEDLQERFEQEVSQGGGPDILLGPATWGPDLFEAGAISDLSRIVGPELPDTLNQAAAASGRYQDALISLPYSIRGVVLIRNRALVSQAPATFKDLVSSAHSATQGDLIGAVLERSFYYSAAHLNGLGGKLMDEGGEPAFDDRFGLAWIRLLHDFEQAGPTDYFSDNDLELFKTGKVGFIIAGSWKIPELSEAVGPENMVIDPWPAYQDVNLPDARLSGYVQSENIYVSRLVHDENRRAMRSFIEFFLSPAVQKTLADVALIPANPSAQVNDQLVAQAMTALAGGTTYPILPEFDIYPANMDLALRSVFQGEVSPAEALRTAQESIVAQLQQMQATPYP
jgi:arabinogalactan oligomer/maltooligosaccharide transport system substrate-binding protein